VSGEKLVNELGGVLGLVFLIQRQATGMVSSFFLERRGEAKNVHFCRFSSWSGFIATWFRFDEICKDLFNNKDIQNIIRY
jgi:hypothetical protein